VSVLSVLIDDQSGQEPTGVPVLASVPVPVGVPVPDAFVPAGLAVLASADWTAGPGVELPAIAGFVTSSFSPLAAVVAQACLQSYFGPPPAADTARALTTAIVLASPTGDLGTAAAVGGAVDAGRRVPPLLFYQSNPNAVAGYIAARWGLAGPVTCTIPAGDPLADALASAALLIEDGDADAALVIVVSQAPAGASAGAASPGPTGPEPASLGDGGLGAAGRGAADLGSAGHPAAGPGAANLGAAGHSAAGPGTADFGVAGHPAAGHGGPDLGAIGRGAADLGSAAHGPVDPGPGYGTGEHATALLVGPLAWRHADPPAAVPADAATADIVAGGIITTDAVAADIVAAELSQPNAGGS
jgi:hypothetical protein